MVRHRAVFPWVYICCLVLGWVAVQGIACGPGECTAPQVKQGDKCVDPPGETKEETKTETAPEPRPEPKPEPQQEPQQEPPAERGSEPPVDASEPTPEPPKERPTTPDEPATPDASEPVQDNPPVERKPEAPPEPSGPIPTVEITSPKENEIVRGFIDIKINATVASGAAIAEVKLFVDGIELQRWSQPPYQLKYGTTSLKDGVHKFKADVVTDLGQKASDEVTFTTSNSGPKINIVSPKANAGVSAAFDVEVQVTSVHGLKPGSVKVEINGSPATWTQMTPNYKLSFDPKSLPFDSFPISITAEDKQGNKEDKEIWVVHEPAAGPKKLGEECDNADAQKRCVADHACLLIGAATKSTCFKSCTVGGASSQCPVVQGKQFTCQVAFQGTNRGACVEGPPQPGSLYSPCGTINGATVNCNTGFLCVGAQRRPDGTLISFCLKPCTAVGTACAGDPGFTCVGLSSGGGACIEQCGQKCTSDSNCSKGQKCTNGACTTPFCQNYGSCTTLQGLSSRVCI